MRVLLMSMPDTTPHIANREWEIPSLGIASIAGNLDPRHEVWLADLIVRRWSVVASVRRALKKYRPDIVGLSSMTFQYFTARKIARLIKREFPGTLIALGGYHATMMYRELADSTEAEFLDFIIHGEGDHCFNELLDAIEGRRSIERIPGLSYKAEGLFRHNEGRPLEDVGGIALPARDRRIYRHFHFFLTSADVMETSRGCWMRCNFCSINKMYGTTFRTYDLDRVLADVDVLYRRGARHVFILDDNITLDIPRLIELCEEIAARKRPEMQFVIQASSVGIAKDPSLPRKLADAGITQVFLGIESLDEGNLKRMQKGKIAGLTQIAVRRLIDNGIIVAGGMINGLENDDAAAIRRNFECFVSMGIRQILDQAITPYPGTQIRRELLDSGLVTNPYDFKWYSGYWPQVRTKHLTSKQMLFERWKARRDILGTWYADGEFQRNYPGWAFLWNRLLRPLIMLNERRMVRMYGEEGRFKRQMMQWARLNDFFGDMVIDESFFDLEDPEPAGIGDRTSRVDFGAAPRADRAEEVVVADP